MITVRLLSLKGVENSTSNSFDSEYHCLILHQSIQFYLFKVGEYKFEVTLGKNEAVILTINCQQLARLKLELNELNSLWKEELKQISPIMKAIESHLRQRQLLVTPPDHWNNFVNIGLEAWKTNFSKLRRPVRRFWEDVIKQITYFELKHTPKKEKETQKKDDETASEEVVGKKRRAKQSQNSNKQKKTDIASQIWNLLDYEMKEQATKYLFICEPMDVVNYYDLELNKNSHKLDGEREYHEDDNRPASYDWISARLEKTRTKQELGIWINKLLAMQNDHKIELKDRPELPPIQIEARSIHMVHYCIGRTLPRESKKAIGVNDIGIPSYQLNESAKASTWFPITSPIKFIKFNDYRPHKKRDTKSQVENIWTAKPLESHIKFYLFYAGDYRFLITLQNGDELNLVIISKSRNCFHGEVALQYNIVRIYQMQKHYSRFGGPGECLGKIEEKLYEYGVVQKPCAWDQNQHFQAIRFSPFLIKTEFDDWITKLDIFWNELEQEFTENEQNKLWQTLVESSWLGPEARKYFYVVEPLKFRFFEGSYSRSPIFNRISNHFQIRTLLHPLTHSYPLTQIQLQINEKPIGTPIRTPIPTVLTPSQSDQELESSSFGFEVEEDTYASSLPEESEKKI